MIKESMEEYVEKRKKKKEPSQVISVKVERAANGYIARREYKNYDDERQRKPEIYKDLDGVMECLHDAFKNPGKKAY
jgi:hypothetical protein